MKGQYRGRRILGFFPHPDDEAYSSAGTLAICARGGADVTVACATRGEKGTGYSGMAEGRDVAVLRTAEMEASCRILGAKSPVFLDFPDGGLWHMEEGRAVGRISKLLKDLRPEVLITLGTDGVYGHRDHMACTRFVLMAVRQLREDQRPRLLHAVFPRNLFRPLRLSLSRTDKWNEMLEPGIEAVGMDVERADLTMDISVVRNHKLGAVACHKSQLKGGEPSTFLQTGLIENLLHKEWFMCVAGPPLPEGGTDPFAGTL